MEYVIEDILHHLVDSIGIETADKPILTSISKQCKKGVALTDRQYELVKNKLFEHRSQLLEHNIFINEEMPTRLPLRTIDRSKYITVVNFEDVFENPNDQHQVNYGKSKWIKVRFPFSKKDIAHLESVTRFVAKHQYKHDKGSHEHYFCLTAKNAYLVCKTFENRTFQIDEDLIELYKRVDSIFKNKEQYMPYTKNGKLFNVSDYANEYIESVADGYNRELICADRGHMFGYESDYVSDGTLVGDIVARESVDCHASPESYNYADIVDAVVALNRFPVVVLIDNDNNSYNQLLNFYTEFSRYVADTEQVVLFREESESKCVEVNDFVKDHNLNNWVDNTTKIVYIKKNKLPKLLIGNEFKPITALANTSIRMQGVVDSYIRFNCDLVLYNDDSKNYFNKWSYGGYL